MQHGERSPRTILLLHMRQKSDDLISLAQDGGSAIRTRIDPQVDLSFSYPSSTPLLQLGGGSVTSLAVQATAIVQQLHADTLAEQSNTSSHCATYRSRRPQTPAALACNANNTQSPTTPTTTAGSHGHLPNSLRLHH